MSIREVTTNLKGLGRRKRLPIQLPFPVSPALRLAHLSAGPKFADVQSVVVKRWSNLRCFAPNVVAGSTAELERLGEQAAAGSVDTSSVDHALVAITRYGAKPLTDLTRVVLWQSFGVPIFELYLGMDHSLLAWECEAHEGWHLAPGVGIDFLDGELVLHGVGNSGLRTGMNATLDPNPCPCGQALPRLINIVQAARSDPYYLAASA